MLVQSRYMQHTEAVMKNPILFGDYRSAKNVRLTDDPYHSLTCSLLQCLLGCYVTGCVIQSQPAKHHCRCARAC